MAKMWAIWYNTYPMYIKVGQKIVAKLGKNDQYSLSDKTDKTFVILFVSVYRRGIGVVEGLAIDAQGNMLYWTDTSFRSIERANLDGTNRRTVLSGLAEPKHIVLFKPARYA